jgi:hypothetical protein
MTSQLALQNLNDQRRVDALLGITQGTPWSGAPHVLAHSADATLSDDLADAFGDESTDDMTLPWSK